MANLFTRFFSSSVSTVSDWFNSMARVPGNFSRTSVWGVGSQEIYSPIEQETAITKGFNSNTAVYSIVKKDAKKFGSIERYLENKADETPIESHPLLDLLNRPNPHQSQDAFFSLVRAFYKVCGESFIWLNRGDVAMFVNDVGELTSRTDQQYLSQPVLEMYVIPSNQVVLLPDPSDPFNILGYQLRNRPDIKFRKEDIIHWKDLNLEWDEFSKPHTRGMPPLKPGFKTLAADNAAIDSMVRMFQNDGAKGAIVNKTVGKMSPTQQTQVRNVIDDKINNKEIKNAVAALEGDWTYLDFGLTSVDMETLKGREFIYKEFCFLFGVPYELFDSQVTYANKAEAQKGWIINEIKPDSIQLDGELNRCLLQAFGETSKTVEICSNFDDLPELQVDKATLMAWLNKAPLTGNQRLEALEYEKSNDPAMEIITSSDIMNPIEVPPDPNQLLMDVQNMSNAANTGTNRANDNGKVSSYLQGNMVR